MNEFIIGRDGEETLLEITPEGAASAYCFKTTIDQFSGKMSFLKVVTGVITPDTELTNPEAGKKGKPNTHAIGIGYSIDL